MSGSEVSPGDESSSVPALSRARVHALAVVLGLAAALLYSPVVTFGIISGDDERYVFQNPNIQEGFTPRSIEWALTADLTFRAFNADYWQPLTFFSRMLDFEMWGSWPGGHHLTNALLHGINASLLVLLLYQATGLVARSFSVAALWAFHPMLVCSVAWVTDRKSLLATLFSLLALIAHDRWRQAPLRFWAARVLPLFVMALLSKPAVAPLPLLLAIWTLWPPQDSCFDGIASGRRPWKRALSHLALGVPFSIVLYIITTLGQPGAFNHKPPMIRLVNALLGFGKYGGRWLWPGDYAYIYPFPTSISSSDLAGAVCIGFIMIALGVRVIKSASSAPVYLLGTVWFLSLLAPGVPLTHDAWTPRFNYFASMGLAWMFVEAGHRATARVPRARIPVVIGITVLLTLLTLREQQLWRDPITLFRHATEVTENNFEAERNLAIALMDHGDTEGAWIHLQKTLAIHPHFASAHFNLGVWYERARRDTDAIAEYTLAGELEPTYFEPHYNRACLFLAEGHYDSAVSGFQDALAINPTYADALNNLGAAYYHRGQPDSALVSFTRAFENARPSDRVAVSAGSMCLVLNRPEQAREWFRKALDIDSSNTLARANLSALEAVRP